MGAETGGFRQLLLRHHGVLRFIDLRIADQVVGAVEISRPWAERVEHGGNLRIVCEVVLAHTLHLALDLGRLLVKGGGDLGRRLEGAGARCLAVSEDDDGGNAAEIIDVGGFVPRGAQATRYLSIFIVLVILQGTVGFRTGA